MTTISLTAEEAEIIREALTSHHHTLLLELSKAASFEFKHSLRAREAVVAKVLEQLGAPAASP